WPQEMLHRLYCFEAKAVFDSANSAELVSSLWNLPAWAEQARALLRSLNAAPDPAQRFVVAAAMIRHIRDDPVMPPALLPPRWPGLRLRRAYESYGQELGELMRREHERHNGPT
ncbi:MAG TPA: PaaX family transcriptional regulator C-terminal domain-containing protein, partial [Acidimicrobiales bacterium]|nr:PaaX family transcriptional regulator C-terminal domain-containing protein [Acidimicrobiales bacterium]